MDEPLLSPALMLHGLGPSWDSAGVQRIPIQPIQSPSSRNKPSGQKVPMENRIGEKIIVFPFFRSPLLPVASPCRSREGRRLPREGRHDLAGNHKTRRFSCRASHHWFARLLIGAESVYGVSGRRGARRRARGRRRGQGRRRRRWRRSFRSPSRIPSRWAPACRPTSPTASSPR